MKKSVVFRSSILAAVFIALVLWKSCSTVSAGPHTVLLTWIAPVSPTCPITGYNVYKSATPGGEVSGKSFASVAGNIVQYVDAAVNPGETWEYKVSAVEATCSPSESSLSSPVSVTIPKVLAVGSNDVPQAATAVVQ